MLKNKIYFTAIASLFIFGLFFSCNKDEKVNSKPEILQLRTSTPTTINGMLHFDTYSAFESYIQNLVDQEQDTNQIKSAYIQLGVDLNQEFLPNLTDYPVALRTEQQITGFTSARKTEETIINNALNNGDQNIFSIISDPYRKSALNGDNSVHIGTRIFKFFTEGRLVIVLNNDWNLYNQIKTANYNNLIQSGNLFITNDRPSSWNKIYNYDGAGKVTIEKQYTESVVSNPESPLNCDFSDLMKVTKLGCGKIRLELTGVEKYDIYEWTFSNGAVLLGNPLIVNCSNGSVSLQAYELCPECPLGTGTPCKGSIQISCADCGCKKEKSEKRDFPNAGGSGKTCRIEATIFVTDNQIGCRSKHFGKNFLGIWVPMNLIFNTNGVFANIIGTFKRETTPNNCIIVTQPFNEKALPPGNNASWQNIISQPGINFMDPDNLSSGHRIRLKTGGTFFGFGVASTPRLILN